MERRMELVIEDDDAGRRRLPLASSRVTLGRARDCTLVLADPRVSRHHLTLEPLDGAWFARDEGSVNGTFLNGARIHSAVGLREGDVLEIGTAQVHVVPEGTTRTSEGESTEHAGTAGDVTSLTLADLAEALAVSGDELAARRRRLLSALDAALLRDPEEGPRAIARVLTEAFGAERLAFFTVAKDPRRVVPILSEPADDAWTSLAWFAELAARKQAALGTRTPRFLLREGVSSSVSDTSQLLVLDGVTLAVPLGRAVVVLEGRRPAPVSLRDELALLLAFAVAASGVLEGGARGEGRSRKPKLVGAG